MVAISDRVIPSSNLPFNSMQAEAVYFIGLLFLSLLVSEDFEKLK